MEHEMRSIKEIEEIELAFDRWWEHRYKNSFSSMPRVMEQSFREIAKEAWFASISEI